MSGQRAIDHAARSAGGPMSSRRVRGAAVVATLLSLIVCGAVAQASTGPGDGAKGGDVAKRAAAAPTSTLAGGDAVPPDELGDDPDLDALADSCFGGDLLACDLLYLHAPTESDYEAYGDTCGGRQVAGTGNYCGLGTGAAPPGPPSGDPVPPEGLGSDPALDALAESCYAGDMAICDQLYNEAESGSAYEIYGDTCGGRQPENTGRYCTALEDPVPGTGAIPTTAPLTPTTVADETTTLVATTVPAETSQPAATSEPIETSQPAVTSQPIEPGDIPEATIEPTGLGDDPALDALAESCFDGVLAACDDLYQGADPGSQYRSYGDTCAGRQPEGSGTWCVDAFGTGASTSVTVTEPSTSGPSVPSSTTTTIDVPPPPVTSTGPPPVTSAPPPTAPPVTSPPTAPTIPTIPPSSTPGVVPPPTLEPTGLGADPALDALAQSCYAGELAACDDLWRDSEPDSAYRNFGDTCAGRQPANTGTWCVDAFSAGASTSTSPGETVPTSTTPGPTTTLGLTGPSLIPEATEQPTGLGDDPALDLLAHSCYDGDMQACDDLFEDATIGSEYRAYGDTCAGRQEPGTFNYCRVVFPSTPRG